MLRLLSGWFEKPEKPAPARRSTLRWGLVDLPESEATSMFAAIGATGSGKTIIHSALAHAGRPARRGDRTR